MGRTKGTRCRESGELARVACFRCAPLPRCLAGASRVRLTSACGGASAPRPRSVSLLEHAVGVRVPSGSREPGGPVGRPPWRPHHPRGCFAVPRCSCEVADRWRCLSSACLAGSPSCSDVWKMAGTRSAAARRLTGAPFERALLMKPCCARRPQLLSSRSPSKMLIGRRRL